MSRFPLLLVAALAAFCAVSSSRTGSAALVTLDHDTTIDAANSYPEPHPDGTLILTIEEGSAGSPTVEVPVGGIVGGYVDIYDSSHLILNGGQIQALVRVHDSATVTMRDGAIEPLIRIYSASEPVSLLVLDGSATLNYHGGVLDPAVIYAADSSKVNIFGYDLQVTFGAPLRILGMTAQGTPIDFRFVGERDAILLHTVPEPSGIAILTTITVILLPLRSIVRKRFIYQRFGMLLHAAQLRA